MPPAENLLEAKLEELERRFTDSAREIQELRKLLPKAAQKEIAEIKDEWHGIHYKWWIGTLAGVLFLFCLSYALYTKLGWVADQRALPVGNDWLLRRLPSPSWPRGLRRGALLAGLAGDKKVAGARNVFILLRGLGRPVRVRDVSRRELLRAIARTLKQARRP